MSSSKEASPRSAGNGLDNPVVQFDMLARARGFAEPFLAHATLDTGENTWIHAQAVSQILQDIGGSEAMQAASYLIYTCDHLNKPLEVIA